MNGAEALLETLANSGIEVCFANPGTSEMQLVAAIGKSEKIRPILCLFEGVASGAADGYGRMLGKPAVTLLHLGCGFSNSMANLHNARRAHTPIVNIVGDHASYHLQYDAPLTSDLLAHANIHSDWVHIAESAQDLAEAGAHAVAESTGNGGSIATIIAPANRSWSTGAEAVEARRNSPPKRVNKETIARAALSLANDKPTAILLGNDAFLEENLKLAESIANFTGTTLIGETLPARIQRGKNRPTVERIPYFTDQALDFMRRFQQVILVGAKPPVAFFAYPGKPSAFIPEDCDIIHLADICENISDTLKELQEALGTTDQDYKVDRENTASQAAQNLTITPTEPLTPESIGSTLKVLLPENAIVSDESITCGPPIYEATEDAANHDWLNLTGGAIGQGLPLSLGAAIACPDRKVVALQADGSAMYTLQSLWTMARENCDVTVIILNNRSYGVLNLELLQVGAGVPTAKTLSMLDLSNPNISWVELAKGMGVPGHRTESAAEFHQLFSEAIAQKGPVLIEACVTQAPIV